MKEQEAEDGGKEEWSEKVSEKSNLFITKAQSLTPALAGGAREDSKKKTSWFRVFVTLWLGFQTLF